MTEDPYRAFLNGGGGTLTRGNDIHVTPGMTVRWHSAPCAPPLWGESKGCLIKGCLNSTETPKVGIPKPRIPKSGILKPRTPKSGIPKTGIPKTGIPKVGKPTLGLFPRQRFPKPGIPKAGIPKAGIPKTGIPKAGIPKTGIPKMGRFRAPLIQTPLRLPLTTVLSHDCRADFGRPLRKRRWCRTRVTVRVSWRHCGQTSYLSLGWGIPPPFRYPPPPPKVPDPTITYQVGIGNPY